MKISRTVTTDRGPEAVFAYLSDFTTTMQWDPGTVTTTKISGDGGVGTIYRNVSQFLGRKTELEYRVVVHEQPHRFELKGSNKTVDAHDVMEISPRGGGSQVVYTAEFIFKGPAKLVAPLLAPAFKKLGDDAERGLTDALDRLPL